MRKTVIVVGVVLLLCLLVAAAIYSNKNDTSARGAFSPAAAVPISPSQVPESFLTPKEPAFAASPTAAVNETDELLSSWVGNYDCFEGSATEQRIMYTFAIDKDDGVYTAHFYIYGFQTVNEFQATVNGDNKSVDFVFDKYLNENTSKPYSEGDILLTLEMSQGNLLTYWGKIQPKRPVESGQGYFRKLTEAEASWLVTENKDSEILKDTVIINELNNNVKGLLYLGMTRDELTTVLKENDIEYDSIESDTGGGSYLFTIYFFDDSIDIFISNDQVDGIEIRGQTPLTAVTTQKGLKLGDSFEAMVELYGEDYSVTTPPHSMDDNHKVYEYKIGDHYFYALFLTDTVDGWGIM